jgi:2-iminobutanoate/2-iminopropanoate deaminase
VEYEKESIQTTDAPAPAGAYSQGIAWREFVFTAGQAAIEPESGRLIEGDVAAQTRQVVANIAEVLRAAGADLADVVKVTVHIADLADFAAFDRAYRSVMPEPLPVRTTVGSTLADGVMVEIDVIAVAPKRV